MDKACKGCGVVKPLTEFYGNYKTKDGHLNWCKPCTGERYRDGRRSRQARLLAQIQAIKVARGCADCGYNGHPAALDFDHLPAFVKEHKMANLAAGSTQAKIEAEMAKCEVVCANCHRIRTANRRAAAKAALHSIVEE